MSNMAKLQDGKLFVMPGDIIEHLKESEKSKKVIVGPGLQLDSEIVYASKPGTLKFKKPNEYWIDSYQKRVCTIGFLK